MDGGDATREVAHGDALEARFADHSRERFLLGETANAFDEVAVGLRRASRQFTEARDDLERVEVVEPVQQRAPGIPRTLGRGNVRRS